MNIVKEKMEKDTIRINFNSERENNFYFTMSEILIKLLNQKFNNFLEYCIHAQNPKPLNKFWISLTNPII